MLYDKVALITGSVRGIGKEIALCFAEQQAKVVINYSKDTRKEEADRVVSTIIDNGGKAIAVCADVSDYNQSKILIDKTIEVFGKIDIVVNNAGITRDKIILNMTNNEFDEVMNVNLKSVFNCTKHSIRHMIRNGGCIINLTSIIGITGNQGQSNYAASKAGIIGFTKSIAKEYASRNIRINAIAPGFINTDMTDVLHDNIKERFKENIPLKRFGTSREVANVALFLSSDFASYITGEVIKVDGGLAM